MSTPPSKIRVLEGGYDEAVLENELAPGETVFFDGDHTAFVRGDEGEIEELTPEEHPEYVEIGSYHGIPQVEGEADLGDDDYLVGWLGRIGPLYFDHEKDPSGWHWCGPLGSDEAAIDYVCGADFTFRRS